MPSFYERKQNRDKAQQIEALRLKIATEYSQVLSFAENPADLCDGLFNLAKLRLVDFFKRQKPDFIDVLAKHPAPSQACAGLITLYQLELFRHGTRSEDRANLDAVMKAYPKNDAAKGVAGLQFILKKNNILTQMNRRKILAHPEPWELYSSWINDFGSILLTLKAPTAQWVFDAVAAHVAPREAITLLLLLAKLELIKDPSTAQKHMMSALHCKTPAMLTQALIHLKQTGFCLEEYLKTLSTVENSWDMALTISGQKQERPNLVSRGLALFGLLQPQPVFGDEFDEQGDLMVIAPCTLL